VKDTGEEEFYETHKPKDGLFGKPSGITEGEEKGAEVFTKHAAGLFGKPTGVFGKHSRGARENRPERGHGFFGKSSSANEEREREAVTDRCEGGSAFGVCREQEEDEQGSDMPGLFGKPSRDGEGAGRRERRLERSPLSQRQSATVRRPERGLFGKGVAVQGRGDSERPTRTLFGKGPSKETGEEEGMRRPRLIFSGAIKPSSMSDAARRSVKKSISIARSKSRESIGKCK
jgi:hypothetical protein